MRGSSVICLLLLFLIPATLVLGQQKTKSQLQKEKRESLQKIKEAEAILKETASRKKISLGQLSALQYQISIRKKLIGSMNDEIGLLETEIDENNQIIESLQSDLDDLKEEYGRMIYAAYKASNSRDRLTFLFSAKNFNQFIRRLEYMVQYSNSRKKQAEQIVAVEFELSRENDKIREKLNEKEKLLQDQVKESDALVSLKGKEQNMLVSLKKREKELKKELDKRKKSLIALNKLIDDIIKKEIEEARRAAASVANASVALSVNFNKNKLKLPWPVNGFVSQKFGITRDPVLKMVHRDSPGIEIQTKPHENAKSVFNGMVAAVAIIQGFNKAIIVKHGDYFTVYAKLDVVYVKKGQTIKVGETLGKVYTDNDGVSELHFEIWHSSTNATKKLNPELWLQKR